jgi:hypothetical protein
VTHAARIVEGETITLGANATMTFLHVDGEARGARFNENSLVTLIQVGTSRDRRQLLWPVGANHSGR